MERSTERERPDISRYGADVLEHGYLGEDPYFGHGYNMLLGQRVWTGELAAALNQIASAVGGKVTNAQNETGFVWFSKKIEDPNIINRAFQPLFQVQQ